MRPTGAELAGAEPVAALVVSGFEAEAGDEDLMRVKDERAGVRAGLVGAFVGFFEEDEAFAVAVEAEEIGPVHDLAFGEGGEGFLAQEAEVIVVAVLGVVVIADGGAGTGRGFEEKTFGERADGPEREVHFVHVLREAERDAGPEAGRAGVGADFVERLSVPGRVGEGEADEEV